MHQNYQNIKLINIHRTDAIVRYKYIPYTMTFDNLQCNIIGNILLTYSYMLYAYMRHLHMGPRGNIFVY